MRKLKEYLHAPNLQNRDVILKDAKLRVRYSGNINEVSNRYLEFYVLEKPKRIKKKRTPIFMIIEDSNNARTC